MFSVVLDMSCVSRDDMKQKFKYILFFLILLFKQCATDGFPGASI